MVTYQHGHERKEGDSSSVSLPTPARITFSSSELLADDDDEEEEFISINPKKPSPNNNNNGEFEFFFTGKDARCLTNTMSTADELFYNGKLLPFWKKQPCSAAGVIRTKVVREVEVKPEEEEEEIVAVKVEENKVASSNTVCPSWYLDEDPSPRPPKCTVLWKELLRLRKQRGSSSLSPSSSSSSTSSSSSSMADVAAKEDDRKETGKGNLREFYMQRIRKGLEKTRSGSMRIRPIASVPVCKHERTNSNGSGGLPPLFPIRK
ncbi:hypothetical protein MLD38_036172 [Melastoma candidum]|uniref:Uncharacterized protein n=1 Tax=Melastoma candidum TaxID=119954 RepID=A0ACB9LIR4_9MYRT|nr:hypothetical protein MLD38_036172 [Melastoma candidum]